MYCNTSYSTKLTASSTSDSSAYSMEYLFDSGDFNNMKFGYFCGDNTANNDDSGTYHYGDLIDECEYLGAQCAFGWMTSQSYTHLGAFNGKLFQYLASSYTVNNSIYYAYTYVDNTYGDPYNTQYGQYEGDGTTTLN